MNASLSFDFGDRAPAYAHGLPPMRACQQIPYDLIRENMIDGDLRRALIQLPTGCGKTRLGAEIALLTKRHNWVGWWVAHTGELLEQARAALKAVTGEYVGMEKAGVHSDGQRIIVCSVQTIKNELRRRGMPRPDVIFIDECHRAEALSYQSILSDYPGVRIVGLTATPYRMDGKSLTPTFGEPIYKYTIAEAISDGLWSPLVWRSKLLAGVSIERLKVGSNGDFSDKDLEQIASQNQVAMAYAQGWFEFCEDRKTIAVTPGIVSAEKVTDYMNAERPGVARCIHGKTKPRERRDILAWYAAARDNAVLVNVSVVVEGFDDPSTSCVYNMRQTKSKGRWLQTIGRGTRVCEGKPNCLIVDLTPNTGAHKLVDVVEIVGEELGASEAVKEIVRRKMADDPSLNIADAVKEAKTDDAEISTHTEETKMRLAVMGRFKVIPEFVDRNCGNPLDTLHIKDESIRNDHMDVRARPAAEKDLKFLKSVGIAIPEFLTERQADKLRKTFFLRKKLGLADYWQVSKLAAHGHNALNWTRDRAAKVLSEHKNGQPREPGIEG
jgi:superfamily II DNA or RNA helicase